MKTKFILHGGFAGRTNSENNLFFKEILKNTPEQVNILLVLFAKRQIKYEQAFSENTLQFERNGENKEFNFEIATVDNFLEQIKKTDIIYFHGGQPLKLLEALKKYPTLFESLKGKIVAGESAGASVLSACFYSKTEDGIFEGLGFVSVKTICHYVGENKERLDKCPKELETLLLKECQFRVFFR